MKQKRIENKNIARKNRVSWKKIFLVVFIILFVGAAATTTVLFIKNHNKNKITINTLKEKWAEYDYSGLYEVGKSFLLDNPYNNTALTYYS